MQINGTLQGNARAYLTHLFGQGLDAQRYVAQRYKSDYEGRLRPWLAGQVGACAVALKPLHDLIVAHVLAAERLHADDTPVPVLAKRKTDTAHAWIYVRDDQPFVGSDPATALFRYSTG